MRNLLFSSHRRAFTLVEILVVIGIILLLAGLLFPVFTRAREGGKRSTCLSNMKQMGLGLTQYAQDNNRRYPPLPPLGAGGSPEGDQGWALTIANLVRSDPIFQCPSEKNSSPDAGFTDYWMNSALLGQSDVKMRQPANVILNGDGNAQSVDYALGAVDMPPYGAPWDFQADYASRHLGGANYSFADGHAKFLKPDQVSVTAPPDGKNYTLLMN